jgi:hypothetical protein
MRLVTTCYILTGFAFSTGAGEVDVVEAADFFGDGRQIKARGSEMMFFELPKMLLQLLQMLFVFFESKNSKRFDDVTDQRKPGKIVTPLLQTCYKLLQPLLQTCYRVK